MSTTEATLSIEEQDVAAERPTFTREAIVSIAEEGDGRTLIARMVPYNETARVNDGAGYYRERFAPGAFRKQLRAVHRIKAWVNYRHRQGIGDQVGSVVSVDDRADGLYGELRIFKTPAGDTALEMFRSGLDRVSIEFESLRHRIVDGVTERLDARFLGLALCPEGAYGGAQIVASREGESVDVEDYEQPPDPELLARMMTVGIKLPDRYKPATDEGTSEPEA